MTLGGIVVATMLPIGLFLFRDRPERFGMSPDLGAHLERSGVTLEPAFTRAGASASPRSHHKPAISCSASRATLASRCSFGACCEHPAYECGIHTVGKPSTSAKTSFGSDPPTLGRIAGRRPVVRAIDSAVKRTHG